MYEDEMEEDPQTWLASRAAPEQVASTGLGTPAELQALMSMYQDQPTMYTDELRRARETANAQQQQLENAVRAAYERKSEGPSKSELYFKLAQSFLTPGQTGNFTEGLAGAAGVAGQYRADQRKAREADLNAQRAGSIELGKLRLDASKKDLGTLQTLDSESRKDRRAVQTKLLEQYLLSGKPQSEAGKQAVDAGFKPGTPEYAKYVQETIQRKAQTGELYKQAMLGIAQGNLALRQGAETRMAQQQQLLTPTEMDAVLETQDAIAAAQSATKALDEALTLNNKIFGGTLAERAQFAATAQVNPKDERVQATETFENLMVSQAAAQLKAIFGGNPTEGERKILLDLQGITAKNPATRESIINRAKTAAAARMERLNRREKEIRSGNLRMRQPEGASE